MKRPIALAIAFIASCIAQPNIDTSTKDRGVEIYDAMQEGGQDVESFDQELEEARAGVTRDCSSVEGILQILCEESDEFEKRMAELEETGEIEEVYKRMYEMTGK
ncbi:hypothetical protein HOH67_02745 [Candidatus Peregrinibacteria bacterium]|jgi:hypothetical protein|nr:hypothetical protein [Candidatus Peregrinibacteria bacterium]